jgi:hypothetical protein
MTYYVQGDYKLRVVANALGELSTGTPYIELKCDVVSLIKSRGDKSKFKNEGNAYVKLWLSDKAKDKTFEFLKASGFNSSISELDNNPEALNGFEFNASNRHIGYNGAMYDNFSAYPVKSFVTKNKVNTSKLTMLDCLFGVNTIKPPANKSSVKVEDFVSDDSDGIPF